MTHTCEIIVRDYGFHAEDLCGEPATKSVVKYTHSNGLPCEDGRIVWLCDRHYEHAVVSWSAVAF